MPGRVGRRCRRGGVRVGIGGHDDAAASGRARLTRHHPRRRLLRHDQARARRPGPMGPRVVDRRHDRPPTRARRDAPEHSVALGRDAVEPVAPRRRHRRRERDRPRTRRAVRGRQHLGHAGASAAARPRGRRGHARNHEISRRPQRRPRRHPRVSRERRSPPEDLIHSDDRRRGAVAVRVLAHAARHPHAADPRARAERRRGIARRVPRAASARRSRALPRARVASGARDRREANVGVRRHAVGPGRERTARNRSPSRVVFAFSHRRRASAARRASSSIERRSKDRGRERPKICCACRSDSSTWTI